MSLWRPLAVASSIEQMMTGSRLAGRALNPIIRTALLLLEPSSTLAGHADEPQRRTSPDEILSSSRVLRFEPEVRERSSSERTRVSNDVLSSRRPETQTPRQ